MSSETGSDNSDHIPITFVNSGTPVAVLVTGRDVPRASQSDQHQLNPGSSQNADLMDLQAFSMDFHLGLSMPRVFSC